jgi:hypothetical protein
MSIILLFLIVVLFAVLFWANNTYVTPGIPRIAINILLIIIGILYLLHIMGVNTGVNFKT